MDRLGHGDQREVDFPNKNIDNCRSRGPGVGVSEATLKGRKSILTH